MFFMSSLCYLTEGLCIHGQPLNTVCLVGYECSPKAVKKKHKYRKDVDICS